MSKKIRFYTDKDKTNQIYPEVEIKNKMYTSGTEYETNECINGKPIYKMYVTGSISNSEAITLKTNVDLMVNNSITFLRKSTSQWHFGNRLMTSGDANHASPVFLNGTSINIGVTNATYQTQYRGFIWYTKKD